MFYCIIITSPKMITRNLNRKNSPGFRDLCKVLLSGFWTDQKSGDRRLQCKHFMLLMHSPKISKMFVNQLHNCTDF
jgi:hypothetical protein